MKGALSQERAELATPQKRPAGAEEEIRAAETRSEATTPPVVSVIIVNFNGRHHLDRCLPSVLGTSDTAFETIVVDNGSTDGSLDWIRENHPSVRVLPLGSNLGFGEANRRGVEAARGSYVAFLNNDTEVDPGWLSAMLSVMEADEEVGAACSTLRLLDQPAVLNARGGGMSLLGYGFDRDYLFPYKKAADPIRDTLFPTAAAMLMEKRVFESVGGFDRAFFMYHEDVDLGWLLWLLGKRVVVCADSIVYHLCGGTTRSLRGTRWLANLGMRHNVRSLIKNYEIPTLLRALKGVLGRWVRSRDIGQALHVISWNLLHLPGTLARRRWVQKRRRRPDRELMERGLISPFKFPPPAPERPVAGIKHAERDWILSPVLLPGQYSSIDRLAYGWYPREKHADGWMRWTCGEAGCFLQVGKEARGSLSITLDAPGPDLNRTVTVQCNQSERVHQLKGEGFEPISQPVQADANGLLEIHITSNAWVPHDITEWNRDYRRLGCRVKEVRFIPDRKPAPSRSLSASVIIPTFNRWDILQETLAALSRQRTSRGLEVIVVDDGSTDGTWERLGEWRLDDSVLRLKTIRQANLKPGRARNNGLGHATGDIVIFLGDDTIPEPDFVESHLAKHEEMAQSCAVLGFTDWHRERMTITPFLEFINTDGPQFGYGLFKSGEDVPFTCFYTSNISVPRAILGPEPFHPAFDFVNWEDIELGYRLSKRGLRIVYEKGAMTRHLHPTTMRAFFKRQQQIGEKVNVILSLHPELAESESMPTTRPSPRFRLACRVARWLVPLFNILDAKNISLPLRVYRILAYSGFLDGTLQAKKASSGKRAAGNSAEEAAPGEAPATR
jgi:GT2 family glycosyltransferase